jgi:hypothetical protein
VAKAPTLAPEQLRTLDRLKKLPAMRAFYLAGATAITWHIRHRRSADLDLFSRSNLISLEAIRRETGRLRGARVVDATDVMLALKVGQVPVDVVKYPYPLLEKPLPGPRGFPVAGLRDLAAMKLSAIARRGIKRDFWDVYALAQAGMTLADATGAYVRRFGRTEADLYHVQRALTWFEDAERDPRSPSGLTPALWREIKSFFRREAPRLLDIR